MTTDPMHPEVTEALESQIAALRALTERTRLDVSDEIGRLESRLNELRGGPAPVVEMAPYDKVLLARNPRRPFLLDYVELIFTDWVELHGDRAFRDDETIVGGWARLEDETVMVIGHQRGRDMRENLRRNFGMAHPEGYRKALRLMKLAEKFDRPLITMIDTPGAYAGIGAEERGQSEAIARNLREMAMLRVPSVSVVIGEGGSGGALGLGVTDRILVLENAVYSVISPEGCAGILWKSGSARELAAAALRLTAADCKELGVADEIVPEPRGGAQEDWELTALALKDALLRQFAELRPMPVDVLLTKRFEKYERIGTYR